MMPFRSLCRIRFKQNHSHFGFLPLLSILGWGAGAGQISARGIAVVPPVSLVGRVRSKLLSGVVAGDFGGIVLLARTSIVLWVSGLTQLAFTIERAPGLVGLAVGIAMLAISEKFLSTVFLSVRQPFASGEAVKIGGFAGFAGYVRQLTTRTTVPLTLDGNLGRVANAVISNRTILNSTATLTRRRSDFHPRLLPGPSGHVFTGEKSQFAQPRHAPLPKNIP